MHTDDGIVAAQLLTLAGLGWPGRPRWSLPAALTGAGVAAGVAGVALSVLGAGAQGGRLTARVEPPTDAVLLRTGPYRISRNPIYAGLLLAGAGAALLRRRPEPVLAWAALAVVLNVKVRREERHLLERFGAPYAQYLDEAPRFLGRSASLAERPAAERPRAEPVARGAQP